MNELTEVLASAAEGIQQNYFSLQVDGGPSVYRERVYCYELYHQMRLRWPAECDYCLNGELHKGGHPILGLRGFGRISPDFLVHRPGEMAGNHAVIEVKRPGANNKAITIDLRKLARFVQHANYARAIYLIYGITVGDCDRLYRTIVRIYREIRIENEIELWLHPQAGTRAHPVITLRN